MDTNVKKWLSGMSPAELKAVAAEAGLKPFAARQTAGRLYKKRPAGLDSMTNLSPPAPQGLGAVG